MINRCHCGHRSAKARDPLGGYVRVYVACASLAHSHVRFPTTNKLDTYTHFYKNNSYIQVDYKHLIYMVTM